MLGIFFVFLACLFWGFDTLIRYPLVMKGFHPVLIVCVEHLILTLIYSFTWIPSIKRAKNLKLEHIFSFAVVGGFGSALATVAFTNAFLYLNPSLVILLQKFQPVFAITLASIILKEKMSKNFLIWAFISFLGCLLISYPDLMHVVNLARHDGNISLSDGTLKGYFLVLISIIGWASATVFGKKLSLSGFSTKQILGGRFLVGFFTLIWFSPTKLEILNSDLNDTFKILLMVIISGFFAMFLYYQGMRKLQAKNLAISEMFFPLSAVVINWFFLDKQLLSIQILGGIVLLFGSIIIQLKKY